LASRLEKTLETAPPETQQRLESALDRLQEGKGSLEDVFAALPDQKLAGAFLSRNTWMHWAFALGAAVLFMAFALLLAGNNAAEPVHLLGTGLFTATVGIVFLLIVQTLAAWSQGVWLAGGNIVVLIVFYVVKLIGFSYQAAADPENGLVLSFLG